MVHLPGQVKDVVLSLNKIIHYIDIADVAKVHINAVFNRLDIEQVATITGDHGIDHSHRRPTRRQLNRK